MRPAPRSILLASLCLISAYTCWGQSAAQPTPVSARIVSAIDERNLVTLTGNVHPLARPEFDRGPAADGQALHRMLLVLQRGAAQESALQQLLADQQNKASINFHKWLTPAEYGVQFGPADADLEAVTGWLAAQGFTDIKVGAGRIAVEFSGNVAQVRNAFHTQMHAYAVKGETHFGNASDPRIPAALSPVIRGIAALNNFPVPSHVRRLGTFQRNKKSGEVKPLFTFPGCSQNCYGVGPADFATIYNTAPLLGGSPKIDGTGQAIAIVGDSNINVQDVIGFRSMFGLPQNFSASNVILNGPDPGINGDETEADLDVEWSGAVAPGATINLVTSESTETTSGTHLSALYIVDNDGAAIMSESFGGCEQGLGSSLNQFYSLLWEQAAAEGITVMVSAGDGGSAGCDDFNTAMTATNGLAVSGLASTPYNVAVGGTDFDQLGRESDFWNTTQTYINPPVAPSALSYIPEESWNESCAEGGLTGCASGKLLNIVAGSGGVSTIYAKPSWQVGKGVPNDNHRDLPDVSLFASSGFNDSFYIICQSDASPADECALNTFGMTFEGVGGTSAAAPAFAGIMALVNQKQATGQNPVGRQGNANYFLYALAQQQNTANLTCNSSGTPDPKCVYHDVTKGNNSVPCAGTSPNCSSGKSGVNGVLVSPTALTTPAYTTAGGYDLATGLGTANVQNLVNKWSSANTTATSTSLTLNGGSAVNITHGQSVPFRISVSPASASGDVSLLAVPAGEPTTAAGPFTLASGVATATTASLPGGTSYYVLAHYEGNGTDAPSDSAPVTVTVGREPSKVFISVPVFDPTTGQETGSSPTTLVYGSPYILRADVTNAQGSISAPCVPGNCPTGTVTFADTVGGVAQGPPNSGTFGLNSAGYTEDQPVQFPGGVNVITATYSGDGSFSPPVQPTTYTLTVTPAPTQMSTIQVSGNPTVLESGVTISAFLMTGLVAGAAPTGTIAFYDGGVLLPGMVTQTYRAGGGTLDASVSAQLSTTFSTTGTQVITAVFSGDPSYGPSTSAPLNEGAVNGTAMTLTGTPYPVFYGGGVTLTAVVTSTAKTPPMTGTIEFQPGSTVTQTLGTDANGNQTLTATTTITATTSGTALAIYSGDANYEGAQTGFIIQVTVPGFSVNVNPSAVNLTAGQQTTTSVMVAPQTNQSSSVAMTCAEGNLVGVSCALSPGSVNLANSASVGATLTLNATGAASASKAVATRGAKRRSIVILPSSRPWMLGGMAGALALALLLWPQRGRRYRLAPALGTYALVMIALGCGGGSSSGGGGGTGGGGGVAATSITITVPASVASGAVFDVSAKITSTNTTSGSVSFNDVTTGAQLAAFPISDGTSQGEATISTPGIHQISASYSGDALNQPSQSSAAVTAATGQGTMIVNGTSDGMTNSVVLTVNIQ